MAGISYEYTVINGRRVRVADRKVNKSGDYFGVDASYGYYEELKTPWGAVERCYVVTVPSLSGGKQKYASIYKPTTNPNVQWSVFEVLA